MSDSASLWPLRLLALAISVSLWLMWAYVPRIQEVAEPPIEADVDALITYSDLDGMTLLNPVSEISVRVRGGQETISQLTSSDVRVQLGFPRTEILNSLGANYQGPVTREIFLEAASVNTVADVDVVSITPDRVSLLIDEEVTRLVPVDPQFEGEPSAGSRLIRAQCFVDPSEVTVTGPRSQVETLGNVQAGPINLDGHAFSFRPKVRAYSELELVKVVQPTIVEVTVALEVSGVETKPAGLLLQPLGSD